MSHSVSASMSYVQQMVAERRRFELMHATKEETEALNATIAKEKYNKQNFSQFTCSKKIIKSSGHSISEPEHLGGSDATGNPIHCGPTVADVQLAAGYCKTNW